jgi:divalent metal cation (Fe/Co/Zn/Cd) transporter
MSKASADPKNLQLRGIRLEQFTISYNIIEGVIAVTAGFIASFVSLIGFGFDSGIEVFAAVLVLIRLRAQFYSGELNEDKERKALKLIGVTFFLLAAYVTFTSIRNLLGENTSEVSVVGIALTSLSVIIMPFLAHLKMSTGRKLGSRLLMADAKETQLCAWLSVSTLVGLVAFYIFSWSWVDSVASLVIAVFAIIEGREAWSGELACHDCDCVGKCTC